MDVRNSSRRCPISRCLRPLVALLVLLPVTGCGDSAKNQLDGKWEGEDRFGQTMRLTFQHDGKLVLNVTGGDSFEKSGRFSVDASHSPTHLDIELADGRSIHTIIQLDGETLLLENVHTNTERPTEFGDNQIVFKRLVE